MTNEEAKAAWKAGSPIICKAGASEIEYLKISALIYRIKNGIIEMTVELSDKCQHSVTITSPSMCKVKEE